MPVRRGVRLRLTERDEYPHAIEPFQNFNESMYFNVYDRATHVGGWFRLGNRPNEGHAEMSCCVYLPDRSVAWMYRRPEISGNDALDAGGMRFEVLEPFRRLRVRYSGDVVLLADPGEMVDPGRAFRDNPHVRCEIDLDYRGLSPIYGGEMVKDDGTPIDQNEHDSFNRAHYEQHVAAAGTIAVGAQRWAIDGLGLRDKSWGPRYWQAIHWYRWLPISFSRDFGIMISIVAHADGSRLVTGTVFRDGQYVLVDDAQVETEWDERFYQTALRASCITPQRRYEIEGRVMSLIPLRNRRQGAGGTVLHTRITEGMTEFHCDGHTGYGLSEYLDQMIDGVPAGVIEQR
ncbi:MAG: DUF7064 domain-containing protein [Gammaproteobacteria bacterium]